MELLNFMQIDINKQEAWKLMDAVKAYLKDYTLTAQANKTFDTITKKLKEVVKE
jgi:hypothetical protein